MERKVFHRKRESRGQEGQNPHGNGRPETGEARRSPALHAAVLLRRNVTYGRVETGKGV